MQPYKPVYVDDVGADVIVEFKDCVEVIGAEVMADVVFGAWVVDTGAGVELTRLVDTVAFELPTVVVAPVSSSLSISVGRGTVAPSIHAGIARPSELYVAQASYTLAVARRAQAEAVEEGVEIVDEVVGRRLHPTV